MSYINKEILIPPPPHIKERVRELGIIRNQYYNKRNPEYMQEIFDSCSELIFDSIIINEGYSSCINFIKRLKNDIDHIIYYHKHYFRAPRPFELAQRIGVEFPYDNLESAQTPSYPSGHTAQSYYIAEVLSSIYPELKDKFFIAANQVSQSRIDRAVHFPSDVEGGKLLAKELAAKKLNKKELY